jgi:hypothetical protein
MLLNMIKIAGNQRGWFGGIGVAIDPEHIPAPIVVSIELIRSEELPTLIFTASDLG